MGTLRAFQWDLVVLGIDMIPYRGDAFIGEIAVVALKSNQVWPLNHFYSVTFFQRIIDKKSIQTSKTTFNNDQQGKKLLGKTGWMGWLGWMG